MISRAPKTEIANILGISGNQIYKYENYIKRTNYKKINRMMKVLCVFNESRNTYGAQRIKLVLCEEGDNVSTKTIADCMRDMNLIPKSQQKIIQNKRRMKVSFAGLSNKIRYLNPTHLDQIWTSDITEIKTEEGKCYLSTIMDKYSRKIISYEISNKMDANLVTNVLKKAVEIRNPNKGIIIHTDKGSQFRSNQYLEYINSIGAFPSYTRPDFNCADNATQESFHASLKKEELYINPLKTIAEAKDRVGDYINNFYNKTRIHSVLKTSPDIFEQNIIRDDNYTNDINFSYINRIDLQENISDNEKDRMYMNLIEMGYEHNEMYPDLNEKIKLYKQNHNIL